MKHKFEMHWQYPPARRLHILKCYQSKRQRETTQQRRVVVRGARGRARGRLTDACVDVSAVATRKSMIQRPYSSLQEV